MSPATIARLNTDYHHCLRREVRQERRLDRPRPDGNSCASGERCCAGLRCGEGVCCDPAFCAPR